METSDLVYPSKISYAEFSMKIRVAFLLPFRGRQTDGLARPSRTYSGCRSDKIEERVAKKPESKSKSNGEIPNE
jgi:hypothetical protein